MNAFCSSCNAVQSCDFVDEDATSCGQLVFCTTCGDEFPLTVSETTTVQSEESVTSSDKYRHYHVGCILAVEPVQKQKDLKKVLVDIVGDQDESKAIRVVTNAKHVDVGDRIVVALVDAIVPAGARLDEDSNAIQIRPTSVAGVMSHGMLCDSVMLGWTGGAKGIAQKMPSSCLVGSAPPSSRPRL